MSRDEAPEQPEAPPPEARRSLAARLADAWQQPTTRFAFSFFLYLLAIALAYPAVRIRLTPTIEAAEAFTAELVFALVGLFAHDVRMTSDQTVFFGTFGVTVIEECTGLYEALLLSAALLAFPTTWGKALLGFAMGFPMIYAMNVVRIALLLVAGEYIGAYFEFLHLYFWQVTMVLMVATTWLVWVKWVVRADYGSAAAERDAAA